MRLKRKKENKTERLALRCNISDYNRVQTKANIYSDGNISEYLLYAALNFVPCSDDLEDEARGKK